MSETEQIDKEAARWVVQNQKDPPPAVLEQLARWLMQSDAHMRAYLRVSRTWAIAHQIEPVRPLDELLETVRAKL